MTRGALPASRRYQVQPQAPAEVQPADSGFLATAGAAFRSTEDEVSTVQEKRIYDGFRDLEDALVERGVAREGLRYHSILPWDSSDPMNRVPDKDAIWAAVEDVRTRDAGAFPGVPATREAYEQLLTTRRGGRARDAAVMGGGGFGARLTGGVVGSFTDPFNVLTAPIGGGAKTVGQAVLQGAVINGLLETIQAPDYIANKRRMGEDVTALDVVANIGGAAIGGGMLEGGFHLGGKILPRAVDGARANVEKLLAASWDHLPDSVRTRWASPADIPDSALPDLAEALIGRDNMSLDERAAATIVRREDAIDAGNPFVPNSAGVARHAESMGQALQRILDEVPAGTAPGSRPALAASTSPIAIASGDARQVVKNRIAIVESGGDVDAANPKSSARGTYQFTKGTWLRLYRQRYRSEGMSDAQILARRSDAATQDRLMDDLMAENEGMLRQVGAARTAGNLYLSHFLGQRGARRVLEADAATPVEVLVGREAVAANRSSLEGKTAGDVIAWAHRKMGELPAAPVGGRTVLRGGADAADGSVMARVQAGLDRADAQLQAVRAEQDAARAAEDGMPAPDAAHVARADDAIDPAPIGDLIPERAGDAPSFAQPVQQQQAAPPHIQALVEPMRRVVADRKRSLASVDKLAEELGKSPDDVRAALNQLVVRGELRQRKDGGYSRPPVNRGPVSALRFVAQNGGLHPRGEAGEGRGGHDLATVFAGRNGRPQMMPGGPIVRSGGLYLDEMGERLWEAGYFGPPEATPRPSSDDVLQLLENSFRSDQPAYSVFDASEVADREVRAAVIAADETALAQADEHARALGHDLTPDELNGWIDVQRETGLDPDAALVEYFNRQIDDAVWDWAAESDKEGYGQFLDQLDRDAATPGGDRGDGGERPGPFGGDPREGPPSGPDWSHDPYEGWEPARLGDWDEPVADAAERQADSIEHDVRMAAGMDDMFGGATRDEKRQALERRTEGGKSNGVDQKPAGSDGGLFDTGARDQTAFRLDEDGEPISPADLLRQIDEDEAAIQKMDQCMVPKKPKPEGGA